MREPAYFARQREEKPELPEGACERVSGYGVMGLPFQSGHVLGLRRWTASSVGEGFTSIWHRNRDEEWTFYESARSDIACTRYFGAGVQRVRVGAIRLEWETPHRLRIRTADDAVDWTVEIGATPITRIMSAVGSAIPTAAWRWRPFLGAMGRVAGWDARRRHRAAHWPDIQRATLRRQSAPNLVRDRQSCPRGRPVHPCCGGAAPSCLMPLPEAGTCPNNLVRVSFCPGTGRPGCQPPPCTPPAPFCLDANQCANACGCASVSCGACPPASGRDVMCLCG